LAAAHSASINAADARAPREMAVLLTLSAMQFTHIVDFMIMMPLGPQFMPPLTLAAVVPFSVLFFVCVTGRFGPGMALVTGSVEPRLRGSFMSFNASIQQLGAGLAALTAGFVIGRAPDGSLTHYGTAGWIAVASTLIAIGLAFRIKVVGDSSNATRA
jgi:hypothetical protein